jgi:uncharacterized membrane protein
VFEKILESYGFIILPLHLISAIVWIGGMVMFIFAVYPSLKQIPNQKSFVRTALRTFRRYFNFLFFFIVILMITGVIMELGGNYSEHSPTLGAIVGTKEAIWVLMFLNYLFAYYKVMEAKKRCLSSDADGASDNVRLIAHYLFGINIFLGLMALYFGLMLKGV